MIWLKLSLSTLPAILLAALSGWLLHQSWMNFQSGPAQELANAADKSSDLGKDEKVSADIEFRPVPLSKYQETLNRPLFEKTRRIPTIETLPVSRTQRARAKPAIPIDSLKLSGVIAKGAAQYALIESPSNPSGTWRGLSGSVDGWKILEISIDHVRVRNGTQERLIHIYVDKNIINTK